MLHPLDPHLEKLIELGTLSRAEAEDDEAFIREVALSTAWGELTPQQGEALCSMLGYAREMGN